MSHPVHPPSASRTTRATLLAAFAVAALLLSTASEANARTRRVVEHNADGSATAHTGVARSGPNGAMLRGRTATIDGQGNGSVTRRGATVGAQGGMAVRQGSTTRSADGSASHSGTVSAQNAQGSLHSSGGGSRNADGSVEQARSTTATSAATGNRVQTQSSYSKDSGLSHSATCYDASGTAMACPTRP
ncbi:MAG: hypothetical protein ABS37_01650 [Acidovorax sp. SCN 65-108]|nr:MAG: hypothetical protein ABS37_01650 [Acidovorax sp. SCN 65-108]OJV74039.1 MAG: hypothetical protein BGO35_06910 [Burkholderiales bacterium 64-34]